MCATRIQVHPETKQGDLKVDDTRPKGCWANFWTPGNLSNVFTSVIFVLGLVLEIVFGGQCPAGSTCWTRYILSFGLFGFAGGVTNWMAITMLFDEIPGVYGSGVIPKQFESIKKTIAKMIMDTFFEPEFLRRELSSRVTVLSDEDKVAEMMKAMFESEGFDNLLESKLQKMGNDGMTGMMMKALSINASALKPFLKKFLLNLASEFSSTFLKLFDPATVFDDAAVTKIRNQIDVIIENKLKELTADKVKALMEIVIREHLGWLVVWGNVFGALIGVVCTAIGY